MSDTTENMALLLKHMEEQPCFGFSIFKNEREDIHVAYEWGKEAEDSPMYAAASYGIGDNLGAAIHQIVDEMRLK